MKNPKLQKLIDRKRKELGSVFALSLVTGIPFRTLQSWLYGDRAPSPYALSSVMLMIKNAKPKKGGHHEAHPS